MSTDDDKRHPSALGARTCSEANDLERTPESPAAAIGFDLEIVEAVIDGRAEADTAEAVVRAMAETSPVSRAADGAATARIYERQDHTGGLAPCYEYRDTAISRTAPFKPEWILSGDVRKNE